jgi:hypothetical protein
MIVIRAIINQSNLETKSLPRVLSRTISLLVGFEYKVFHILREHNNFIDECAKHGTNLGEGVIEVNGVCDFLHLP